MYGGDLVGSSGSAGNNSKGHRIHNRPCGSSAMLHVRVLAKMICRFSFAPARYFFLPWCHFQMRIRHGWSFKPGRYASFILYNVHSSHWKKDLMKSCKFWWMGPILLCIHPSQKYLELPEETVIVRGLPLRCLCSSLSFGMSAQVHLGQSVGGDDDDEAPKKQTENGKSS